ncbi:MAG: hypothetical protein ACYCSJ_05880 [Acidimicrobiales bacterium]
MTGLATLAAFGLWSHPSVSTDGYPGLLQAGAAAVGVGLTLVLQHLVGSHHAFAAATSLLITTGLARPGNPLYGLLIGLTLVILGGPLLGRLPFGDDQSEADAG